MSLIGKKLHHFVPRFYLRSWAEKEKIHCLQDGRVYRPNVRNVCATNYFYTLQRLSAEDMTFLREAIITGSPNALKETHEQMVRILMLPYVAKERLEHLGGAGSAGIAEADRLIVELNENLHTDIEDQFRPFLDGMIAGDISFLTDVAKTAVFYWCLAVQYARTNHVKQVDRLPSDRAAMYRRLANPLVHMVATNVGCSLFVDRERYSLVLLQNSSSTPFVTADQPIINIACPPNNDLEVPTKFELYYPLSPTKAMLLLEPGSGNQPSTTAISETAARQYNLRLAAHANRQVLATSATVLEEIRRELPVYLSCFP
jgi:hypothetical protein